MGARARPKPSSHHSCKNPKRVQVVSKGNQTLNCDLTLNRQSILEHRSAAQASVSHERSLLCGSTLVCVSLRRPGSPPDRPSEPGCLPSLWRRWHKLHLDPEPFVFGGEDVKNPICVSSFLEMFDLDEQEPVPVEGGLAEGDDRSAGLTHPPGDG